MSVAAAEGRTMQRGWMLALGAVVALGLGVGVGYLAFDDGHGSGDDHGLRRDQMADMMADGSMPEMMSDFTAMMEQMQGSMTPEMRERMDRDPMWTLMASGEMADLMELHMQSMDGMLGVADKRHGRSGNTGMD